MSVLVTENLTTGYKRQVVTENISVSLDAGELVCLLGPNGAGKSTLMRTLAGMQPPLSGNIFLMGKSVQAFHPHELARHLSIVLTQRTDTGNLSAYELVSLGRYPYTNWSGHLTDHDQSVVQRAIEAVGATNLAARPVNELSDGERQKIMIARALAQEPDLILLDEPTAFLDLPRRVEIMRTLRTLARETGRAILLSTHDLDLALRSADKLWLLPIQGQIQVGAPEDLILSGAFEAAFHSEGVDFDQTTGTFRVHTEQAGDISLVGNGLRAIWTRRALEREGFQVTENKNGLPRIEIFENNWCLKLSHTAENYASLHDLMTALRKIAISENIR